jgi:hypothetical protein
VIVSASVQKRTVTCGELARQDNPVHSEDHAKKTQQCTESCHWGKRVMCNKSVKQRIVIIPHK